MDAELRALLRAETERHAQAAANGEPAAVLSSLHALKGALALAGLDELAGQLREHERAVKEGGDDALAAARATLVELAQTFASDREPHSSSWPVPPAHLRAVPIDAEVRAFYAQEVQDRLLGIDEALDDVDDPASTLQVCFRHVHTIKGAASAVRDEPMAWFCHGLETRLEAALTAGELEAGLHEMRRHRRALHGLLRSPAATLDLLRGQGDLRGLSVAGPLPGSLRIGVEAFDSLLERVSMLGALRERELGVAQEIASLEVRLREMRHALAEALRLIGPPKPWGAPAAAVAHIESVKADTERVAAALLRTRHTFSEVDAAFADSTRELRQLSASMRRARVSELFRRTQDSLRALGSKDGVRVTVTTEGGDELVDRRTLEALGPAMVHLARNAIAHGPGAPGSAARREHIHVALRARRVGNLLSVEVEDDGVGTDVAQLTREAAARGLLTDSRSEPSALLPLLFFPGFSTSARPSELAGRGLGLDIVAQTVRRLGGSVRLRSAAGQGFHVMLDLPSEAGLLPIVWLEVGARRFGAFASDVLRIEAEGEADDLASVLRLPPSSAPGKVVVFGDGRGQERAVRVGGAPRLEDAFVRPLGPIARTFGPFSHAVSRADGSLRLILDAAQLLRSERS